MTVFVAVDSGGSKTTYAVWRDGGDRPLKSEARFEGFTGNLRITDFEPKLETIQRRIRMLLKAVLEPRNIAPDEPVVLFVSAAGFAASTRAAIEERIASMPIRLPESLKLRALGVCNDAVALLLGHDLDVSVIAGTGSNVLVKDTRDARPSIHQLGGHNWLASDPGGGFQIGLRGIRQAMKDHEERQQSSLYEAFFNCYHVTGGDAQFIQVMEGLAVAEAEMKGRVAKFAAYVCNLASTDPVARTIVEQEARELADLTARALQRHAGARRADTLRIAHSGSLFHSACYRAAFEHEVGAQLGSGFVLPPWQHHPDAQEAVMNLARRIDTEEGRRQLAWPPATFRPFVLSNFT